MKFLIDNALSPSIAYGLIEKGHDALHVRNIGLAASSDLEIIDLAARQDRVLISSDTDFGAILTFRESTKPSFILFRQSDKQPASQLSFLLDNLPALQKELLTGCVIVLEDKRIRIRSLPISKS